MKIDIPCWILSTPRTGSTYLADLLNSTFYFGKGGTITENTGCVDRWTEYYCDRFFHEDFIFNPPKINKIQYHQYVKCLKNQDIEKLLPNIKYVLLRRKDTVATAVSHYFVMKSQKIFGELKWNVYTDEEYEKFKKMQVNIDIDILLSCYEQACKEYRAWEPYLSNKKFIELDYDDIVFNPQKSVDLILNYMGIDRVLVNTNWSNLPKKQINSQKNEAVKILKKAIKKNVISL